MSVISEFACELKTPEETYLFAEKLAKLCRIGDSLLLYGDVGAGKTTFARGFIQSLMQTKEEIVSPTFTLVQTYPLASGGAVWHCDLYRLKSPDELLELGLDEAFDKGIILVEWPEIAASQMPKNSLNITLKIEGQGRKISLAGNVDVWQDRLEKLDNWKK